ncbi:thiamine pyrophosphate-binding protein [Phenylobacterium montanum]|uniref:Thiamine pyrophosphate-binding protein n=2 Tax=Phenylobacterium montanum TaxID=2823693 RepID=A0A975G468_9CAUL|nr:thiamine pyrophosphate-binding protein [Caulobacter sp. S6]QUD90262.1 thiamine pyrophosphate-binding protein [Caulobacter sp. S6]
MAAGADAVFGLHGAHIDTLFQALLDHRRPVIDTRHEAAAGHAAEGLARVSGGLGVALLTAGGGFTNGLTSIANAWLDRTPVLYIAGSGPRRDDETNTLQAGIDQIAMAKPVTKWAHRVLQADHLPRLVAQAIRVALTPPRGPVLLDIPWDVLTEMVEVGDLNLPGIEQLSLGAGPARRDLDAAMDQLGKAQRPVVVLGSEASRSSAAISLERFTSASGIPAFADYEALHLLSGLPDSMNGGLVQGLHGLRPDAVLMLGVRFGLNTAHGSGALLPHDAEIIQVDPDARELGRLQAIAQGVAADVGATLDALAEAAPLRSWPNWDGWRTRVQEHIAERARRVAAAATTTGRLHPYTASAAVGRHIGPKTVVVADGALTYLWFSEVISKAKPAGFLCHGYLGSMGVGFGVALGAQWAAGRRGQRTILVTGDGAVGYSLAEFDTAVRHGIPLVVVVMNNQSWGATLHFQQFAVGPNRITNTRLENGSYAQAAAAFGADHYRVETAEALDEALSQALSRDRPACIEVMVAIDPIPPEERVIMGGEPFAAEDADA